MWFSELLLRKAWSVSGRSRAAGHTRARHRPARRSRGGPPAGAFATRAKGGALHELTTDARFIVSRPVRPPLHPPCAASASSASSSARSPPCARCLPLLSRRGPACQRAPKPARLSVSERYIASRKAAAAATRGFCLAGRRRAAAWPPLHTSRACTGTPACCPAARGPPTRVSSTRRAAAWPPPARAAPRARPSAPRP